MASSSISVNYLLENNKNLAILNYILAQVNEGECPYVNVDILGNNFYGLLDSGANKTFMGQSGWNILRNAGIKLDKSRNISCKVANDDSCTCIGVVAVPIRLRDVVKIIEIYIVPQLRHSLVLGIDFWVRMGIVPDVRRGEWHFSSDILQPPIINGVEARSDLNFEQNECLTKLLDGYFSNIDQDNLGCTNVVKHKIVTSSEPIKQRYYPVSPFKQKLIDEELDQMLKLGVIEKSTSGWSSPVLMVPKKDGTFRFCVDFRKLNSVTEKDAYPLPYISSILTKLGGSRYLSSMDIKSAFWQIKLDETSKPYTAFTIPGRGLFQWTRMPFGLHNAPATFQRLVDTVFGPELEPYVFVYLDDIILATPTFEKHLEVLSEIFRRLNAAGLTLKENKCVFCRSELKFLGYVINRQGILVDPSKVEAIVNLPRPKTVTEVRRIIGMIGWYRRFVDGFSDLIAPLTRLLRKGKRFEWDESCEKSFQRIKDALVSAPILTSPNFEHPFYVQTDASAYGVGCVLTQRYDGREHVICYLSRTLSRSEANYSSTERELLAVLYSIEKLRCYLEGYKFYVITDCHSLVWLNNLKNPQGRLARWALRLQQFDYEVVHRKGKDNIVPDTLSRNLIVPENIISSIVVDDTGDKWYLKMLKLVNEDPLKYPKWRVADKKLYKYVSSDFPELFDEVDFWKLVIPKDKRREILYNGHDICTAGHFGIYKTFNRIARLYYWPSMRADITKYVRSCATCLRTKPEQKKPAGFMSKTPPLITKPWQYISTDLFGPLPKSSHGNLYILAVTDAFSKFVLFFPLRHATALAVTKILREQVFLIFGVPQFVRCDNGPQYRGKEMHNLANRFGFEISFSPNYSAHCNPTERVNRVLKAMLSAYVKDNHRKWDENLAELGCAIRTAQHEVTSLTPYFINFGKEMILHGSEYDKSHLNLEVNENNKTDKVEIIEKMRNFVKKRLEAAHVKYRNQYNLRHRDVRYEVDDLVWKRNFALSDGANYFTSKLAGKFSGPYRIKRKVGYCVYELVNDQGKSIGNWHTEHLKPHITEND